MTIESFPPENSMPGLSNSAATSRMMWIDSASSSRRLLSERGDEPGGEPGAAAEAVVAMLKVWLRGGRGRVSVGHDPKVDQLSQQ